MAGMSKLPVLLLLLRPERAKVMAVLFAFVASVLGGSSGTSLIAWQQGQVFVPLLSHHSGQRGPSSLGRGATACPLSPLS